MPSWDDQKASKAMLRQCSKWRVYVDKTSFFESRFCRQHEYGIEGDAWGANRQEKADWMLRTKLFCKKQHNVVAPSLSCVTLLTRSEKRGLRKRRLRSKKRLMKLGIRNDLLKNTEATKRGWKPEFVVRKQKAKLCAVHENAQASVV